MKRKEFELKQIESSIRYLKIRFDYMMTDDVYWKKYRDVIARLSGEHHAETLDEIREEFEWYCEQLKKLAWECDEETRRLMRDALALLAERDMYFLTTPVALVVVLDVLYETLKER